MGTELEDRQKGDRSVPDSLRNYQNDSDTLANHHRRHHPSAFLDSPSPFSVSESATGGGRKRQFSLSSNGTSPTTTTPTPDYYADDGGTAPWHGLRPRIVKLYAVGIPTTATEQDIRLPFGEHGNVIEVVFIKSKWNAQRLDSCFVKYSTLEEADRAIGALNDRYTFPGGLVPIRVRYADKEKERFGSFGQHLFKLYVGCVNKQVTEREIEEIFSPFGVVEDVFIVRGEMRQPRGCAFVQFLRREMAVAAINALHGSYIMRGCDQPLIVRFADPKKPKCGSSRTGSYFGDQVAMVPNDSHLSPNKRCKPHLVCASNPSECGLHSSSSAPHAVFSNAEPADSMDFDWSEHICPDGYPYYYNCVTCESKWEKPEEYALYERQLLKLEQQSQHISHSDILSTTEVSRT